MILVGQRFEKKRFLLVLMGLFVVGSLITAGALLAGGAFPVGVLIWQQTKRSTVDAKHEVAHAR